MIITFRPEFTPPWVGRPHVTMLTLNRLPRRQRAEMIAYMTSGKALPKEIAEQIIDRTDGVPLFIEELTKTVVESGIVTEAGDHYAMAGPVASLAIPTSLHASLLARLDRLAPTREVAQIGAALGRTFSHELIRAVAGMPQQKLDEALAQLVSAELIFRRGTPPDAEYTFKHALVQDAAYSTLLRSRRQQLHARIATTLESQFTEIAQGQPELLAQHCAEAGLIDKAVSYRLKAGQKAVARSAMQEALSQLQSGLDLLTRLPEGESRQLLELELQVVLQAALIATRGYAASEVDQNTTRSRELCEQLRWPSQFVTVLYGQFVLRLTQRSDLSLALDVADELYRFGEARNHDAIRLFALEMRGMTHIWRGELVAGCDVYKKCLEMDARAHRDFFGTIVAEDPYVAILTNLACGLFISATSVEGARGMLKRSPKRAHSDTLFRRRMCWAYSSATGPATWTKPFSVPRRPLRCRLSTDFSCSSYWLRWFAAGVLRHSGSRRSVSLNCSKACRCGDPRGPKWASPSC